MNPYVSQMYKTVRGQGRQANLTLTLKFGLHQAEVPNDDEQHPGKRQQCLFGVEITGKSDRQRIYSLLVGPAPYDVPYWFRVFKMLQAATVIDTDCLKTIALAAMRHSYPATSADTPRYVNSREYLGIMTGALPQPALDMLYALDTVGLPLNAEALTDEVERQTLPWNSRLADMGVLHPTQAKQREQRKREITRRYADHIGTYLAQNLTLNRTRTRAAMEHMLIDAVTRGLEEKHGLDMVMALAVYAGYKVEMDEIGDMIFEDTPLESLGAVSELPGLDIMLTDHTATWCAKHFGRGPFKHSNRSEADYRHLVPALARALDEQPVVHPLYDPLPA